MKAVLYALCCSFLIVLGQVFWKLSIDNNGGLINSKYSLFQNFTYYLTSKYMLLGIFIYLIATIFWMYLLGKYNYSYIYPMFSITYVFSFLLGIYIFNENVSIYQWIGVVFIICGVVFISKGYNA